jgi:glutathione synthase
MIMDPIDKLHPDLDTTMRLSSALKEMGDTVYYCQTQDLSLRNGKLFAQANVLFGSTASQTIEVDTMHSVHMRKDPPYDLHYLSTTWLLDYTNAPVWNSPKALRDLNEKISILEFPEYIDPVYIGTHKDEMKEFIHSECNNDAILKPLLLYSGKGVQRINAQTLNGIQLGDEPVMIQPFNHAIFDGEVRVFTVCGKALMWCLKKPAKGQYMANSNFGSTRHNYKPSTAESSMIEVVAQALVKKGVYVVGFDVIGGKISEINITSPRLLWPSSEDPTSAFTVFATIVRDYKTV